MKKFRQVLAVAGYNFRMWRKNPRIFLTFALTFIMCFLLTDKTVTFAAAHNTTMQLVEAFIWCFGDSGSILLISTLLVLLFADMPFLSPETPFFLIRTDRKTWITGQVVYIFSSVLLYLMFVLVSTVLLSARHSFSANMWSPTAAILGYTDAGKRIAVPALLKTLEMSYPYPCMLSIFALVLGYAGVLTMLMLVCTLRWGTAAGAVGALLFSLYGILLSPQLVGQMLNLSGGTMYIANVLLGWISPLNHASYSMHNFGYDMLPRLWHSYLIFGVLILLLYWAAIRAAKRYQFTFTGTEG